jgi:integrase
MAHQTGYIWRVGRSWYGRWREDVIENGAVVRKQRSEKLAEVCERYRTKADVRPLLEEKLRPLNERKVSPESTLSISQFVEGHYLPYVVAQKRPSTLKGYRDIWEDHLRARIGRIRLRDFRTCDGERLFADIARKTGLSHNSLKHIKTMLSGVFTYALRQGTLTGVPNPMRETSVPRGAETPDTYAYSLEEVQRMLAVLPEPARAVVATAAYTGLRKGELRGLRWEDLGNGQLQVSQSVWNSHTSAPKTKKSAAPVPVIRPLGNALAEHAARQGNPTTGPIFRASNGKPLNLDNLVTRAIVPALEGTGIAWHGWHAFRRGLATNLHRLGVDDKTIQAILRHSNLSTTMNIYVKSVSEAQVEAMQRLEEALGARTAQRVN